MDPEKYLQMSKKISNNFFCLFVYLPCAYTPCALCLYTWEASCIYAEVLPIVAEVLPIVAEVILIYAGMSPIYAEVLPLYAGTSPLYAGILPI